MLYDIGLTFSTTYANPVSVARHLLRLVPADLPGAQTLHSGRLVVTPAPVERSGYTDFFGNAATEIVLRAPHDEITVRMEARVDRFADPGLDLSPDLAGLAREIAAFRGLGADAPHHFLGSSPRIAPAPEMTAYAREVSDGGLTAFGTVCALGMALHRDMKFDPEATNVETPPSEAFARRHGVCQDFAQVMIAALRGIGVPAGYVSGFLRTNPPPGKPRLEGADAMHAWVRAWCGVETGWIEFDPTNAAVCATDHIVVAYGRDYGDVSPMRGVLRISGGQKIDQKVDVVPVGGR